MANEVKQEGSPELALGYGGELIGILLPGTFSEENTGTVQWVKDWNANDVVAVISNLGKRITCDGFLKSSATAPKVGDVISVKPIGANAGVNFLVEASSVRTDGTTRAISLTLNKPDAATLTAS